MLRSGWADSVCEWSKSKSGSLERKGICPFWLTESKFRKGKTQVPSERPSAPLSSPSGGQNSLGPACIVENKHQHEPDRLLMEVRSPRRSPEEGNRSKQRPRQPAEECRGRCCGALVRASSLQTRWVREQELFVSHSVQVTFGVTSVCSRGKQTPWESGWIK